MGRSIISTTYRNLYYRGIIKSTNKKDITIYVIKWIPQLYFKSINAPSKLNVRNRNVINEINNNKENVTEFLFCLPYAGSKGEQLVKHY